MDFESRPLSGDVDVFGRRNSIRLEPDLWETLREIDLREKRTMHDICPNIDKTRGGPRLTSAIRIYMVSYCRSAANPYRAVSSCFAGIEIWIFRADHFAVRRPHMARIHWRA